MGLLTVRIISPYTACSDDTLDGPSNGSHHITLHSMSVINSKSMHIESSAKIEDEEGPRKEATER
jgi:hypothetical protein